MDIYKKAREISRKQIFETGNEKQFIRAKDIEWLIEMLFLQTDTAARYESSLEEISDILEGENVTPLVERLAYVLSDSGIYDED